MQPAGPWTLMQLGMKEQAPALGSLLAGGGGVELGIPWQVLLLGQPSNKEYVAISHNKS